MSDFYEQVYAVVRCIPEGRVTSYGRVAQMLCNPRASRAVGYALRALYFKRKDPAFQDVPWQRVVNRSGFVRVAAPGEDEPLQVELLREEGVVVRATDDGRFQVDMKASLWEGLSGAEVDALFPEFEDESA